MPPVYILYHTLAEVQKRANNGIESMPKYKTRICVLYARLSIRHVKRTSGAYIHFWKATDPRGSPPVWLTSIFIPGLVSLSDIPFYNLPAMQISGPLLLSWAQR
jgi:hypothetical protein